MTSVAKHDRESIYSILKDEILRGEIEPGQTLREVAVSHRFGVSRTPVRDAFMRLTESGLLERTVRGLEVRGVDPQTIVQVYDMRILLEEEVAGQAAQNRTINDLLKLEALLERDQKLEDKSDLSLIKSNLEFHRTIWAAAHNPIIEELLIKLGTHLVHVPRPTLAIGNRWKESLDEHSAMIEAIRHRDAETARSVTRNHFEKAREIRLRLLREMVATEL